MKAAELKGQSTDQLREQLSTLKKEAMNLRFQAATGELQNTNRKRHVRRDIARILTVLNSGDATATPAKKAPAKKAAAKKTETKAKKAPTKKAKAESKTTKAKGK